MRVSEEFSLGTIAHMGNFIQVGTTQNTQEVPA
jgi:hypothetical protein